MKSEFKEFQKIFATYQKRFGLNGYRTYFKNEPDANSFANINVNQENMIATINISSKGCLKSAKHEALHLLVGRLAYYAEARYVTEREIMEAEEELVRRLEILIPD